MYYHYTKQIHLPKIIADGYIKVSTAFTNKREKKAVWLTISDEVEPTAVPTAPIELWGGMARIAISDDLPVVSWAKYKWVGKIDLNIYKMLDESAKEQGSDTSKWFASLDAIPKKYWISIEILVDNKWIEYKY